MLPYLQTHLTIREIGERLFVSCVVAAAPKIALALGYDVEEEELLHQG